MAFNIGRELAKQPFTLASFKTFLSWQQYSAAAKRAMLAGFKAARAI